MIYACGGLRLKGSSGICGSFVLGDIALHFFGFQGIRHIYPDLFDAVLEIV